MDSIHFLVENDPIKLQKNPIFQEYLAQMDGDRSRQKSAVWKKVVAKLSKNSKLIAELKKGHLRP